MTAKKIVCVGDSITYGSYDVTSYPVRLNTRLGISWTVIDTGVGGWKTADMLSAFTINVIDNAPEYVIILGGTNDLYYSVDPSVTHANITAMCDDAELYGISPILCLLLPCGFFGKLLTIPPLNAWISNFAATRGYSLIDFYTPLNDPANPGFMLPAYTVDGTHPNDVGAQAMVDSIDLSIFDEPYTPPYTPSPVVGVLSYQTPRYWPVSAGGCTYNTGNDLFLVKQRCWHGANTTTHLITVEGVGTGDAPQQVCLCRTLSFDRGTFIGPFSLEQFGALLSIEYDDTNLYVSKFKDVPC